MKPLDYFLLLKDIIVIFLSVEILYLLPCLQLTQKRRVLLRWLAFVTCSLSLLSIAVILKTGLSGVAPFKLGGLNSAATVAFCSIVFALTSAPSIAPKK